MTMLATSEFTAWLRKVLPQIESALERVADDFEAQSVSPRLATAMRYALLSGGKRVRPALSVLACEAVGGNFDNAIAGGVAIEMIHAYSLVHDDLPCMDDDALRRGQPTVHVAFDEATAVLVGDALQSAAFQTLAKQPNSSIANAQLQVLAWASGAAGMVGGQQLDMDAETSGADFEKIAPIHRAKTGVLIEAAPRLGAIAGGGDDQAWSRWGGLIGALFQATDDILDATCTTDELGKTAGKDQAVGKVTLVTALGLDEARKYAENLAERAALALNEIQLSCHQEVLMDIPKFLLHRSQ